MIEKITPRALDKSSDPKLVSNTSMIDALNVFISEDTIDEHGYQGSIKNVKGNNLLDYAYEDDIPLNKTAAFKAIGSVTDPVTGLCYVFMWSEDLRDHGIWVYDKDGKLPHKEHGWYSGMPVEFETGVPVPVMKSGIRKVFTSAQFNFPENGFVKGDIVYKNSSEFYRKEIQTRNVDDAVVDVDGVVIVDDQITVEVEVFKYPDIVERLELPENAHLKKDFDKDCILYFTDSENEPRKINVYRALLNKETLLTTDANTRADLICACPKAPLERITFEFSSSEVQKVNNFATTPGLQFAYQNIYKDGAESAISTYSKMAFPPSVLNRGAAQISNLLGHNLCTLKIPEQNSEIEKIRILARYGNSSNFFEIDEVNNVYNVNSLGYEIDSFNNWNFADRTYLFYNDRVGSGVSPHEVDKTFDNLPQKAQGQTVISNRLVYGNYLEGYDNVKTECTATVIYNDRPQDFIDLVLKANPSIEPSDFGDNRSVGFQIDTTEIPSNISENTVIKISLNYSPDKNFHIYQAHDTKQASYHQSRAVGKYSSNAVGYRHWPLHVDNNLFYQEGEANIGSDGSSGFNNTHANSPADLQEKGFYSEDIEGNFDSWVSNADNGSDFLKQKGEPFFGRNFGVGARGDESGTAIPGYGINSSSPDLPLWRVTNSHGNAADLVDKENGHRARYGTSAGNPLIIQGKPLHFEVKFKVTQDIVGYGKKLVSDTVVEALAGADGTPVFTGDVANVQGGGGGLFTYAEQIEIDTENDVINTARITKDEYDLQLGYDLDDLEISGNQANPQFNFDPIVPGSPLSYLICGVGALDHNVNHFDFTDDPEFGITPKGQGIIPFSYFIINRAEVDFYLEAVQPNLVQEDLYGSTLLGGDKSLRIAISKIDVEPEDIMTCIKRLDPNSPWWAVHPSTIQNEDFALSLSIPTENPTSNFDYTIWNTSPIGMDSYNADEFLEYKNSVPYKFKLDNAILHEGAAQFTNPYKWFIGGFALNHELCGFNGDDDEGIRFVNLGFCGYMDTSSQSYPNLFHPIESTHSNTNESGDYIPQMGLNRFQFSLMDGEGGPGAANAGDNTAYNNYGNSTYGSIAAKVDFGYDGSAVELRRSDLYNGAWLYQAMVGGSRFVRPGTGQNVSDMQSIGSTPLGTGNSTVATSLGLEQNDNYSSPLWPEAYVVSGPFFTGSIAMNPVVGESTDSANTLPFPPVKDFTTTLPLIWTDSEGVNLNEGINIPRNWLKTSYPWPQVIRNTDLSFLDNSGFITNAEIDHEPFAPPLYWSSGITGEGELESFDQIDNIVANFNSPLPTKAFGSVDFSLYHSHVEGTSQSSWIAGNDAVNMSFKSSATHEFGIVYYDQRGRHGYVNHLASAYVEGYSTQSRGDANSQGSAHIELQLAHNPPQWAYNYKIVYSKNTTVDHFIQYSAGGAFTAEGETPAGDPSRIYMSLNYLQGHPISYSSAWGARSKEGSMAIYTPKDGDRLRVISYMLSPSGGPVPERVYPLDYDFEISGVVSLDDSISNPLATLSEEEVSVDENRQGLFLLLKNNDSASGFRYQDVRDGVHNWGSNCIVEIYSPIKQLDADDRLYYEIGDTYRTMMNPDGTISHAESTLLMTEGDVYFRSAAVNLREYNAEEAGVGYQDIIINTIEDLDADDDQDTFRASESNFKSYYIESPVGTDLFESDSISIGRPNIIKHDAVAARKKSSVIHSDRDITDARKVSYSSFNRSRAISKDLDPKPGEINYLTNHGENCFFVQRDKCGYIPIDRSIISDVSGESSLIASSKFFNTPRYYEGRGGCDNNPESVVSVDSTAYFAHKSFGEVYKVSGVNGVNVISENNMKAYFKKLFSDAIHRSVNNGTDVRVVGGFDPKKHEYLLTVLNPGTFKKSPWAILPEIPHRITKVEQTEIEKVGSEYGCMDPSANNFTSIYLDPQRTFEALKNDNSCRYTYGCMDPNAPEFNPEAGIDDGSCSHLTSIPYNVCEYNGLYLNPETNEIMDVSEITGLGNQQNWSLHYLPTGYSDPYWYAAIRIQTKYWMEGRFSYGNEYLGEGSWHEDMVKSLAPRIGTEKLYEGATTSWYLIPDDEVGPNTTKLPDGSGGYNGWIANGREYIGNNDMLYAAAYSSHLAGGNCVPGYTYIPPPTSPEDGRSLGTSLPKVKGGVSKNTVPLVFTGNLCDYPLLLDAEGQITASSIMSAFNTVKSLVEANNGEGTSPYNNDGVGGLIAATHLFPNFAGGGMEPSLETFHNIIPNPPAGPNIPEPPNFSQGFPSFNFSELGGNWFGGLDSWSALAELHPDWYTLDDSGMPQGGPTPPTMNTVFLPCTNSVSKTFPYTGNLCDYPALAGDNGMIDAASSSAAYQDIMEMVAEGELSAAEATFVFPDLNNDGQIQIQDLLDMIQEEGVACNGSQPYTGNPCDYPLLYNSQGVIDSDSVLAAYNSVRQSVSEGTFSDEYSTTLFPDFQTTGGGQGNVGVEDMLELLTMVPVNCEKFDPNVNLLTKETRKARAKTFSEQAAELNSVRPNLIHEDSQHPAPLILDFNEPNNQRTAKKIALSSEMETRKQRIVLKNTKNTTRSNTTRPNTSRY